MELAYAAYNPLTGPIAPVVPGLLMEEGIPTATELLESEGFNAQSYNYGASDAVAHVIAHRTITVELGSSDAQENNILYTGEITMSHLEQTIGIIIATIAVVLSYCGLAFIGIVSK